MYAIHGRKFTAVQDRAVTCWLLRHALPRERGAAAPQRRHDDLVAAADPPVDLRTWAEAKILTHADAHLAQPPAVTGYGDGVAGQAGTGLHEGFLDLVGRHRERLGRPDIGLRDLHGGARLADGFEIGGGAQPRAGAVLIPFVEDQARRRHRIEHGGDDVAVKPWRWPLAELREAVLVLRPQPMHHERVGPRPALLLGRRSTLARPLAERRRPGQRQYIEVELAGFVLAAILCRCDIGAADEDRQRNGGKSHATSNSNHRCPPYSIEDK